MLTLPGIDRDQSKDFNVLTTFVQIMSWMPLGVISTLENKVLRGGSEISLEMFGRSFPADLISITVNKINNQVIGKIYLTGATGEKIVFDISGFAARDSIAFVHIRYERRSLYNFLLGDNSKKRGTK